MSMVISPMSIDFIIIMVSIGVSRALERKRIGRRQGAPV
jgi:hypothetical protein